MGQVPKPGTRIPWCPALGILRCRERGKAEDLGWKAPGPLAGPNLRQALRLAWKAADMWDALPGPPDTPERLTIDVWVDALPYLEGELEDIKKGIVPARLTKK